MRRTAIAALPATVLALLLSGCGGKDAAPAPAPAQSGATGTSTPSSTQDTNAAGDVKIKKCEKTSWTQNVDIEVTNSTGTPWKYVVGVTIKDTKGEKSEANFVKNRIEPGKTVAEQIPGDTPLKGEITCSVGKAKRMPAQ